MRRFYFHICLILLSASVVWGQGAPCNIAKEALETASSIRKLKIKHPVPCLLQDKEEVKSYLLSLIDEQLPPERLHAEETVLKKLGFLPEAFNYKQGIVDLYLAQIGGFYDPKKDRFVMASWLPAAMQTTIAVHELTHALQDQYYDLEKLINPEIRNGDNLLAHSALAEGDATSVMYDYTRKQEGAPSIAETEDISSLILANMAASHLAPASVPKSLQMVLIFPYTSGFHFVHKILRKGGYEALKKVFNSPPGSTEEILYPEKYFSGKKDYLQFSDDELRENLDSSHQAVYHETFGQFSLMALLSMSRLSQADIKLASDGWGGDRLVLFEKQDGDSLLRWKLAWDSRRDLEEFRKFYFAMLNEHHKNFNSAGFTDQQGAVWQFSAEDKVLSINIRIKRD